MQVRGRGVGGVWDCMQHAVQARVGYVVLYAACRSVGGYEKLYAACRLGGICGTLCSMQVSGVELQRRLS